jgi:hypothetical protein
MLRRWIRAVIGGGGSDAGRMGIGVGAWLQTVGGTVLGWGLALLVVAALVWTIVRRRKAGALARRTGSLARLFGIYAAVLLLASLLIRLKEPRYVIGLAPAAAVLVGAGGAWRGLADWMRHTPLSRTGAAARGLVALFLLLLAVALSPLRLLPSRPSGPARWVDPFFWDRAVRNDRYYTAVAHAGAYLKDHTPPDAVIAVIHEATVVGYYADRSYRMLYTLDLDRTLQVLAETEFLVYDRVVFVRQTEAETQQALDYIQAHFELEREIHAEGRRVVILRNPNPVGRGAGLARAGGR